MYIGGDGGIIDLARKTILDDDIGPEENYLWKTIELIAYLNTVMNELYEETLLVEDRTTTALTQIKLLSNLGVYTVDERVLNVKDGAKLSINTNTDYGVLKRTTEAYMDQYRVDWREINDTPTRYIPDPEKNKLIIYPKFEDEGEVLGDSDITFTASTKKISRAGEDFTAHYAEGDEINVDGTVSNDGYFTVAAVTATEITVTGTLVNESNTSAEIRKVEDTLVMVVNRLPLAPFTVADITASPAVTPEFKAKNHYGLLFGIGREANLKPDSQTYNPYASKNNGDKWEAFKNKIRKSMAPLVRSERQPKSGSSGIWKGI